MIEVSDPHYVTEASDDLDRGRCNCWIVASLAERYHGQGHRLAPRACSFFANIHILSCYASWSYFIHQLDINGYLCNLF